MLSLSKLTTIENGIDFPEQKDIPSKNEARKSLELPEEARILVVIGRLGLCREWILWTVTT